MTIPEHGKQAAFRHKTECPECKETFKGLVGKATHMRKAHNMNTDGSKYVPPEPKTKAIVVKSRPKKDEHHVSQNPSYSEPTELYAYITAHVESIIHRVAFEHDLIEKQFAQGYFRYISRPKIR